ncbi:transposase [Bradyrhizobium sp. USDA 4524]
MGGMDASPAQTAALHPKSLHSQLRYKRLEDGIFRWPKIEDGVMRLSAAQLSALLEGLDWRLVHEARETPAPARPG